MALPAPRTQWPPAHARKAFQQVAHDQAWLQGDTRALAVGLGAPEPVTSPYQYNGGVAGTMARAFLGKPQPNGNAQQFRHLPVPAALAAESAAMLVGLPPAYKLHPDDADNATAAETLSEVSSTDEFAADLQQAAYHCAGLGWVIGRITWDTRVSPHPWIEWVDPDQAILDYQRGKLRQVTFWDVLPPLQGSKKIWRLVQVHTRGRIEFGLYAGDENNLGMPVPYTDHPDAAYLADPELGVDENLGIDTGIEALTAYPIHNDGGAVEWRTDPQLKRLGESDIRKAGGLWADIDRIYTDLILEYDTGKARLLVSDDLLDYERPGSGSVFNLDRTILPLAANGPENAQIEQVQFTLRVQEFLTGIRELQLQAVTAVGLSPITVGLDTDNSALTATEIRARSRRTMSTWNVKSRFWRAGLSQLLTALLNVDAALNGTAPLTRPINVAMHEPVQETELDIAETLGKLRENQFISIYSGLQRLHPEWTSEEITEEHQRILKENSAPDPFLLGSDVDPSVPDLLISDE